MDLSARITGDLMRKIEQHRSEIAALQASLDAANARETLLAETNTALATELARVCALIDPPRDADGAGGLGALMERYFRFSDSRSAKITSATVRGVAACTAPASSEVDSVRRVLAHQAQQMVDAHNYDAYTRTLQEQIAFLVETTKTLLTRLAGEERNAARWRARWDREAQKPHVLVVRKDEPSDVALHYAAMKRVGEKPLRVRFPHVTPAAPLVDCFVVSRKASPRSVGVVVPPPKTPERFEHDIHSKRRIILE